MMKKILIVFVLLSQITFAQKAQKIGYIDRDFVLENIPEYTTAQSKLDTKINTWNAKLDKLKNEIEAMKLTLANERALLTIDLITDKEEDITIKQNELKKLNDTYFGTSGDLFMLRKQLVRPIQDQIFNAIQDIVSTKKFDIIFDKSSNDMVMLYTNPKYDVSELVLQKIVKGRKVKANAQKKTDRELEREKKKTNLKNKANDRKTKQEVLREKIKKQNEAKAAKRAALKKANEEKRAKKKAEVKARREALKNKGKKVETSKEKETQNKIGEVRKKEKQLVENKDAKEVNVEEKEVEESFEEKEKTKETTVKTKEELKAEKRQKLVDRAISKKAKRDSLRKVAADKRAKKIAELEARKKKLQESKNK
ncbi:MAG: OmpH family outer membrane protein [Flavobacteriaceae bacterium]